MVERAFWGIYDSFETLPDVAHCPNPAAASREYPRPTIPCIVPSPANKAQAH